MITHETTVTVKKPVQDVFKYIAVDYAQNHPKWDPKVVSTEVTSKGPLAAGSTGKEMRKRGSQTQTYMWQVTEFEANKKLTFKTTSGPAQFSSSYLFQAADGGTKVVWRAELGLKGFMGLFELMVKGAFRKEIDAGAKTMADLAGK